MTQSDDELRALKPSEIVGTIAYGETVGPLPYTNGPLYRALKFTGAKGDAIDAWVRSSNGDARAWLVSGKFTTLKSSDNASASETDAHLVHTLGKSGTHYIVWRENNRQPASFTVSLNASTSGGGGGGSAFKAKAGAYQLTGTCEIIGASSEAATSLVTVFTQPDGTQPTLRIETISGVQLYYSLPLTSNMLPPEGGKVAEWARSEVGGLQTRSGAVTFRKTGSSYSLYIEGAATYGSPAVSRRNCTFAFNEPFSEGAAQPDELPEGVSTAMGSCQGSETYPHACVPGTPGRDANGCCTTVSPYGGPADIQFEVSSSAAGGARTLDVIRAPSFTPDVQGLTVTETGAGTFDAGPSFRAGFTQGAFVITTSKTSHRSEGFCGVSTATVNCRLVLP